MYYCKFDLFIDIWTFFSLNLTLKSCPDHTEDTKEVREDGSGQNGIWDSNFTDMSAITN